MTLRYYVVAWFHHFCYITLDLLKSINLELLRHYFGDEDKREGKKINKN